jgi:hypothetical protein
MIELQTRKAILIILLLILSAYLWTYTASMFNGIINAYTGFFCPQNLLAYAVFISAILIGKGWLK